ncbi:hypothetical protein OXT66_00855 [Lentilactobacillus senioris]|uniref:hypothetical protein n=1 Tax=Lentilactobacillus senioris TaxID=931534 RepID=UPI0022803B1D|nr:hypothetical protein [Lentilactobacillus senioris]MCY9806094.1 hypothetical protein [Lentilactobacillus senioris]
MGQDNMITIKPEVIFQLIAWRKGKNVIPFSKVPAKTRLMVIEQVHDFMLRSETIRNIERDLGKSGSYGFVRRITGKGPKRGPYNEKKFSYAEIMVFIAVTSYWNKLGPGKEIGKLLERASNNGKYMKFVNVTDNQMDSIRELRRRISIELNSFLSDGNSNNGYHYSENERTSRMTKKYARNPYPSHLKKFIFNGKNVQVKSYPKNKLYEVSRGAYYSYLEKFKKELKYNRYATAIPFSSNFNAFTQIINELLEPNFCSVSELIMQMEIDFSRVLSAENKLREYISNINNSKKRDKFIDTDIDLSVEALKFENRILGGLSDISQILDDLKPYSEIILGK